MEYSKEWLTVQDIATIMGISRQSVTKLIKVGHLRAKNMSTSTKAKPMWRIHPQWLEDFKESSFAEVG